jgi:hypothetical protein
MDDARKPVEVDAPTLELWALALEGLLVLGGVLLFGFATGAVQLGDLALSWTLTTLLLSLVAGALVPWTRGVGRGARWLGLTLVLGAVGALLTAPTLMGILLLSVIRNGFSPSMADILSTVEAGGPAGAWLGAEAGVGSGALLGLVVMLVDGVRGVPANPDRPGTLTVVLGSTLSALVLVGVAELQHHQPTYMLTGCSSLCQAWPVQPMGRWLGDVLALVGVAGATFILDAASPKWRGPAGTVVAGAALLALALANTVHTSTLGTRYKRHTLGLPALTLPARRELIGAELTEEPGTLVHRVVVRWRDGQEEVIVVGLGPFRPDLDDLLGHMEAQVAELGQYEPREPGETGPLRVSPQVVEGWIREFLDPAACAARHGHDERVEAELSVELVAGRVTRARGEERDGARGFARCLEARVRELPRLDGHTLALTFRVVHDPDATPPDDTDPAP